MLSVDRLDMCNRRNKPICQGAVFLALLGGLGYSFYSYSIISMDLEISRSETEKYFRQQESLSSQLQVVYEHRARLERSLQKEKTDHKNTKLDFSRKQNDFILNVTRSKHEAMNRFNSLETQYNMLKAQNKERDTDYNRLQQQYTRLSSEHSQLNNQQKRNYQLYKEQKTNEIASLDEEIKTLKLQVVSLRTHLKTRAEEIEQYKLSSTQALVTNQKHQKTIRTLQEQLASYKERLENAQARSVKASKDVKQDMGKTTATRHQESIKAGVVDQEEKERAHQEKEIHTGLSRSDNRHSAPKHTSQERHRRQTYITTTPTSDSVADQADKGRPDDNEQKQDVYSESHSDQAHDAISLSREEVKINETSQSESEQRHHDNVPLKDSNKGIRLTADREPEVHVVSPTENTINNWANIIEAAHEGDAAETEENNGIQEEGEDENEDEWNKRSVDDHKEEAADTSRLHESDKQKRARKEDVRDKRIGRPVAQAVDSDVRPEEPGYQGDNAQIAPEQYQHRSPDDQHKEINIKDEEEGHERDERESDLSRKIINKQVAKMQNDYQDKRIKQQQEEVTLPQEQDGKPRHPPVYRRMSPPLQRQDKAEEHREQSDADNDDEDADTEQDTEKDPDDADEEDSDMLEPRESPQEQQQQLQPPQQVRPIQGQRQTHQDRNFERALKSAESNNNEQSKQKA